MTYNQIKTHQNDNPRNHDSFERLQTHRYAMVSTEMRRDLNDPLRYFQRLETHHLYHITPWNDMAQEDIHEHNIRYDNALDLYNKLVRLDPNIVQGVEPFALRPFPRLVAITEYVKRYHKPLVVVSLENLAFQKKYGPASLLMQPFVKRYLRAASLIIYINDGARDNFLRYGAEQSKMIRLMYGCWGVDTEEFSPVGEKANIPLSNKRMLLFVGRIHRIKGVYDLLKAFERVSQNHSNVDLVFIGSGPDEEGLAQQARAAGIDSRVHFLGTVKNRDLASYLRRAEVLIAPSQTTRFWAEQVGMVLIQAMGAGVPVVSTTSGSIPEFVRHEKTGLLVPEQDPLALAKAIETLLCDEELRQKISAQARSYTVEHFNAQHNVRLAEETILEWCS